jgi:hypothetical protein
MITTTTAELLGMIGDMLPFVDPDKDSTALHCVRIEQSGDRLTMLATNRAQAVRVSWEAGDSEGEEWRAHGSDAHGFDLRLTPSDAKAIVSTFKLGMKLDHAPVTLSRRAGPYADGTDFLKITREASEDHWSELTMVVTGRGVPNLDAGDAPEIDIHELVDKNAERAGVNVTEALAWTPRLLANLGKVERHGVLTMSFTSMRDGAPVYVKAGKRFDGIMYPVKRERGAYRPGADSDILRTGSGLLVAADAE